jgi:hypothetical protein
MITTVRACDSTNGNRNARRNEGVRKMFRTGKKLALKIAALTAATMGLSGCYYDMGLGYYDNGYASYDCDPYSPFDRYYDCDYGYGFYNIGYGGGWYDSYWYPGYGTSIFDSRGRRYGMGDHHRRYWSGQRHNWYRDNRGRDGGHHRNGYTRSGGGHDAIALPQANGGRGDRRGRRSRGWNPGEQQQQGAVSPPPVVTNGTPPSGRSRGDGHRGNRGNWNVAPQGQASAVPAPAAQPAPRIQQRQGGNGGGRNWQAAQQNAQPAPAPAPRVQRQHSERPSAPRGHGGRTRQPD